MASDIEVEWDEEGQRICIRRHGPGGPYSVGTKGFAISATFPPKGNRTIFNSNMAYLGASEQTDDIWQKCIDLTKNARKSSVKLIERIARAMCKADGNDPDQKSCYRPSRTGNGLAHNCYLDDMYDPIFALWTRYTDLAETAILELEAAAMEPFRTVSPGEPQAYPWYPPETLRDAWATWYRKRPEGCGGDKVAAILAAPICIPNRIHEEDISSGLTMDETTGMTALIHERIHREQNEDRAATADIVHKAMEVSAKVASDAFIYGAGFPRSPTAIGDDSVALTSASNPMPGDDMLPKDLQSFAGLSLEELQAARSAIAGLENGNSVGVSKSMVLNVLGPLDALIAKRLKETTAETPISKDAPLIEAIRRERENGDF